MENRILGCGPCPLLFLLHLCCALFLSFAPSTSLAGVSTVAGSVFCDQCLNGHHTMWGRPLNDAKVLLECKDSHGTVTLSKAANTSMIGAYAIRLQGSQKLDGCTVSLAGSSPQSTCAVTGVATRPIELSWKLFGMAMYTADGLFYKPSKPMSFCPNAKGTTPSPKVSLPRLPFAKLSACTAQDWLNPQYKCFWRVWSPKTKVGVWYGPAASKKFGSSLTLEQGLRGSGEVNRVLLRESIAATLNAFNSLPFYYNAIQVSYHFNQALAGSNKDVLKWALNFKRANSGYNGKAKCLLTPCK
ncbi:hypothetical protein L7F22_035912 [Adiantum nelumboides]|nr:hypothetical protein [Adiantum nelumboides]